MTRVLVDLDETVLIEALRQCRERKISFDGFINDSLGRMFEMSPDKPTFPSLSVHDVLESAVARAQAKIKGEEFLLADLCSQEEWESLNPGGRKSLGKGFRKAVETTTPPMAEYVRRTSANKAVYRRL